MLSYQHGFHAGNLADVQKHGILSAALSYLTQKDKPLSYIETHAGRALYDLSGEQSQKTGEAAQGILKVSDWFDADHPYSRARQQIAQRHGASIYPGSPAIASALLRPNDSLHLAELHPGEYDKLQDALGATKAQLYKQDGFALTQSLCPPSPRRGLLLIDPPYEVKSDYALVPKAIVQLQKKWNVGVIMLWYPILSSGLQDPMVRALENADLPNSFKHEVRFLPAKKGHGMIGSGLFITNMPWGLRAECKRLSESFANL